MFFFKLITNGTLASLNKISLRSYKTNKIVNVRKLVKSKKIKTHEVDSIDDIELLLHEKHHDVLQSYPTIKNVNKVIDVRDIPVFKKCKNPHSILSKVALHFGDLSYLRGDAVVNGTNNVFELTKEGNGYDCSGNFLKTCGDDLFNEIKNIRDQNRGKNILITKGYNSMYKCIIHVVEPYYNETTKLKKCYEDILLTAKKNNLKTIVFPLLGSGISLFKKHDVVICCLEGIYEFLKEKDNFNSIDKVVLTTITDSYWMLLRDSIPLYLDEHTK
ncbi:Appr-1-p processing domain protein, putative [Plasmodium ovale]|uniref:Appr-1-p processing enzyme, putative n=2 Tax=Plasmodium ovale TaxID=36330 RepID=A0A1A8W4T7_PLAOA|nr:Appr-1-p processing enzyme, putative [Plasmodium ovale curtisi]SBS97086.1 Appr-1-p processing enzyme, putative [Plasmodium ovale curtisi]SCP05795.1 Appr-1-p processing domain protein, putative [Plasmodium ovale]